MSKIMIEISTETCCWMLQRHYLRALALVDMHEVWYVMIASN